MQHISGVTPWVGLYATTGNPAQRAPQGGSLWSGPCATTGKSNTKAHLRGGALWVGTYAATENPARMATKGGTHPSQPPENPALKGN